MCVLPFLFYLFFSVCLLLYLGGEGGWLGGGGGGSYNKDLA